MIGKMDNFRGRTGSEFEHKLARYGTREQPIGRMKDQRRYSQRNSLT